MNIQNYKINLRVGTGITQTVKLSQGDIGRELVFFLYDGAVRFSPPSGATVKIKGTKPSGLGFDVACTLSGNVARVLTTIDMTQESGNIPAELEITNGTVVIGTANFIIYSEPSPHPAGTIDGTTEEARTVLEQCEYYAGVAQDAASAASGDYTQLAAEIGTLSELTTTAKSSAVAAINEVNSGLSDVKADLGDLDELETTAKTDLVSAINEAASSGGSGLTDDVKQALYNCISHIGAWTDDHGQDYVDALYGALYPPASLMRISCVYTQSGVVYDNDTLDGLKTDLLVTAHYDNGTTQTVTTYTLSGTLTTGTSTITVTYGGKTTTFNVTVTHATTQYSITNTLAYVTNSNNATVINEQASYSATLSANSGYVITSVSITMGGTDITSTAYNSSTKTISIVSVTGNIVITATGAESAYQIYDTIMANSGYTYNADNSIFFPDYVTLGDVASVDELQLEFEMQLQAAPTQTKCLIGAKSSNSAGDTAGLQFNVLSGGLFCYIHSVSTYDFGGYFDSVLDLGRHIIKYENTNVSPSTCRCDNESKTIEWTTNGGCTKRLGLSFCNGNDTIVQTAGSSLVKFGYVKIWDKNGTLLNHFVPAVRKSDNFVGMYDEDKDVFITANTNTRYVCGTWT